ncbi:MAG: hypothetical protein NVS3B5_00460 [Sphingomicrobium sp.]
METSVLFGTSSARAIWDIVIPLGSRDKAAKSWSARVIARGPFPGRPASAEFSASFVAKGYLPAARQFAQYSDLDDVPANPKRWSQAAQDIAVAEALVAKPYSIASSCSKNRTVFEKLDSSSETRYETVETRN